MELKLVLCVVLLAATFLSTQAEFYFNHVSPKENELSRLKLKCIPGRTIIKIEKNNDDDDDDSESGSHDDTKVDGDEDDNDNDNEKTKGDSDEKSKGGVDVNSKGGGDGNSKRDDNEGVKGDSKVDEKEDGDGDGNGDEKAIGESDSHGNVNRGAKEEKRVDDTRRTHMNAVATEGESCRMCVCSVEGKDEYCSKRPARNVNECIRMATIMKEYKKNIPYNHDRILAYNIRRDYIWHKDEIPYEATAKCRRGLSYYTNSLTAMDSDIEVPSDLDSLLDYSNRSVCFYCICAVDGSSSGCMQRDVWFCNYYRAVNQPQYSRDYYRELFQQDRPSYFRQLSYRLRRTMDDGIYDLLDTGGDTLCCNHPDGHRRSFQKFVRSRVNQMKNKGRLAKENLLSGQQTGDYADFIVNNDK